MTAMEPKVRRPMSELMTRLRQITLPDEPNTIDSDGIVTIFTVREVARVFGVEFQFHGSVSLHIQSCEGFSVTLNETEEVVCCRILQSRLGDEQLFDTFIGDLMDLIIRMHDEPIDLRARALERRVACWRAFMHAMDRELSPELERGLFGELTVLKTLLIKGVEKPLADLWTGPLRNEHDFSISKTEALEVKTSSSKLPFVPCIDNVMQLDSTDREDLMLVAVHLVESPEGETLAELYRRVEHMLSYADRDEMKNLMLVQHVDLENPGRELKRFSVNFVRTFRADSLPRITRGTVPGIVDALYRIVVVDELGRPPVGVVEVPDYLPFVPHTSFGLC